MQQTNPIKHGFGPPFGFFSMPEKVPRGSANHGGSKHVFNGREFGQQVVKLKDDSNVMVAITISARAWGVVDAFALKLDFAAIGLIECRQKMHERAFTTSTSSNERGHKTGRHLEVDAA